MKQFFKASGRVFSASSVGVGSGLCLLGFLHFYRLSSIPGLHFDEAWAMNFAWKISTTSGFWPYTAMSPYTAPWTHYWAALWLWAAGPSVFIFRASQVSLALTGLFFLCFSLPKHLRAAFPWAVLLTPGLVLNHRFAIELTGFHVFCFGLLCWSLRERRFAVATVAALLGTTAHILFYAVPLSLVGMAFLSGTMIPRGARRGALVYFALMALFFARVMAEIPEKGKAAALVTSALTIHLLLLARAEQWKVWKHAAWRIALPAAALAFTFNCLFFAQGFWSANVATGYSISLVPFETLLFAAGSLGLLILGLRAVFAAPSWTVRGFLLLVLFAGLMMLKPAPRYFELGFLGLAVLFSWDLWSWIYLVEWPMSRRLHLLTALAGLLAINLGYSISHYFLISPVDSPVSFLFFRDSSRDFLDKQSLVGFLGGSGCRVGDIRTHDPRLLEELKALSLGDWPLSNNQACAWSSVARRTEEGATGELFGEFLLQKR